jgi:drug/metabolite transporter (DMT)-like permease
MLNGMNTYPISTRYTLAGIAAVLLWGTTIAFSRSLTEQLGTLTAASLIYIFAGLFGIAAAEIQARGSLVRMTQLRPAFLWGCGALFVLYMVTLYTAVGAAANRSQVLAVGLINYLWPGLSLLFSIPILNQKARPWLPVGLLLSLAGVWLAMTSGSTVPGAQFQSLVAEGAALPYFLALIAAISWGLYTNLSRRWGGQEDSSAVPLFLLASGLVLGAMRLAYIENTGWTPSALIELAYMALFPAMLAYILWDLAVRKGNFILAASLSYLTPLLSTLFSSVVLNVTPGAGLWAGACLVVAGAVVSKLSLPDQH